MERGKKQTRVDFMTMTPTTIKGVIHGTLPNKSNSRRIFRGISIKSQEALDFVDRVKLVYRLSKINATMMGATSQASLKIYRLLYLKAVVYGKDFQRDLDVELLPDALQHAGAINNDRAIRRKFLWWELDRTNPRVEFEIGYIEQNG